MYDYLIVGAGFFGATFARIATDNGYKCLVVDKKRHIGGTSYSFKKHNIEVYNYGPHIFYTNDDDIWNFVNRFSTFKRFTLNSKAVKDNKYYSLPFNMNTFNEVWGITCPMKAMDKLGNQAQRIKHAKNLEEKALSLIGTELYELLVKDYTKKLWGKEPKDLPAYLLSKIPLRFTFDNDYFDSKYCGIPTIGYGKLFEKMLEGIEVTLNTDFLICKESLSRLAKKVVYTGRLDSLYDYCYGELEYRTVKITHKVYDQEYYQGIPVLYHHDANVSYTRTTENKMFLDDRSEKTIVTYEEPEEWSRDKEPFYPVNTEANNELHKKYLQKANEDGIIVGGRVAEYRYYDMHHTIGSALATVKKELQLNT